MVSELERPVCDAAYNKEKLPTSHANQKPGGWTTGKILKRSRGAADGDAVAAILPELVEQNDA